MKKNIKSKIWWIKLGVALVLSNVLFFLLFSGNEERPEAKVQPEHVHVHLKAELFTPFETGKKVLIVHRNKRKRMEAVLHATAGEEGRYTVQVHESHAPDLFFHEGWEIVPFIKTLTFAPRIQGENHEIHY